MTEAEKWKSMADQLAKVLDRHLRWYRGALGLNEVKLIADTEAALKEWERANGFG